MQIPEIDVARLARAQPGDIALVDVREPAEYRAAHVPGAVLIPLSTVPDALERVPEDRPVYVICATGRRSLAATEYLRANGRDAANVAGGTKAWIESGRPIAVGLEP